MALHLIMTSAQSCTTDTPVYREIAAVMLALSETWHLGTIQGPQANIGCAINCRIPIASVRRRHDPRLLVSDRWSAPRHQEIGQRA
ncbi:hypothetical protein OH77DRAFT_1172398 [Trametes cingulata]|nr:hypothetical protein OH77DRAFT_1172398 [Trametes cingulata]